MSDDGRVSRLVAAELRLDSVTSKLDEVEARNRLVDILLSIAHVQADAMTSVAASRVGDEALAKQSLISAARMLKSALSSLGEESRLISDTIAEQKAIISEVESEVRGQR
jgi:hypothetical protein